MSNESSVPRTIAPVCEFGTSEPGKPRTVSAERLFDGSNELWIVHRGERYRLQITRNNKLILTK